MGRALAGQFLVLVPALLYATGSVGASASVVCRRAMSSAGPEFVSKALLSWIVTQGIGTALIEPGKPWQNGVAESFNGKVRDECLSLEWFRSRAEAKVLIEEWRRHFNEVRPHSSLGYLPRLAEFDQCRADALRDDPRQQCLRHELGPGA